MQLHRFALIAAAVMTACSTAPSTHDGSPASDATSDGERDVIADSAPDDGLVPTDAPPDIDAVQNDVAPLVDAPTDTPTTTIHLGTTDTIVATSETDDDYVLHLEAHADSRTVWSDHGNEALVLAVRGSSRGFIGHLILHQGMDPFDYSMHLGHLTAGETVSVSVSDRSAARALPSSTVTRVTLTAASTLGAMQIAVRNAPVFLWPVEKSFDDVPLLVGYDTRAQAYTAYYTNENGGTCLQCAGSPPDLAVGVAAEIGRWGRASDIESIYTIASPPTWKRCTGSNTTTLRMEGSHPRLYYGSGHNALFEDRSGYGRDCGTGLPEMADGNLNGWNSPSGVLFDAAHDDPYVIVLRPVPIDLARANYTGGARTRERLVDRVAPWHFRIMALELEREGKIDHSHTFDLDQYLYMDVHADDINGSTALFGCSAPTSGGYVMRVHSDATTTRSGTQQVSAYAGTWKRVAIPLEASYPVSQLRSITFDAFDNDGIYWLDIGDVFVVRPSGDNGATIDYVHMGLRAVNVYVDDNNGGCTGGFNTFNGTMYPCAGSVFDVMF